MINWNDVPKDKWEVVLENRKKEYLEEPNRYIKLDILNGMKNLGLNESVYDGRLFKINPVDGKLDVFDMRVKD